MNHNEEVPDFLGGPGDMSRRGQDNLWQSRSVLPDPDSKALARKKRDDVKTLRTEIASLKGRIAELEEQAKLDQMYIDDSTAEIDRLNGDLEGPFLRKAPGSPRLLPTLWLSWKR